MSFTGTQQKCKACEKTVYPVELLSADGVPYHKSCFKCTHCKGTLKDSTTGYIAYDKLEEKAMDFRPKLIICGGSAYPRDWDYKKLRAVADKCGALLLCDMAHISGLVAAQIGNFLAELAKKLPSITFLKVDVDELKIVAQDWAVEAMPTFIFLKGGKIMNKVVGAKKEELQQSQCTEA